MLDWLHGLPFVWLVVVVFGVTYLVAASITAVPALLAEALRLALAAPASLRRPKSGAAGDGRRTRDRP